MYCIHRYDETLALFIICLFALQFSNSEIMFGHASLHKFSKGGKHGWRAVR